MTVRSEMAPRTMASVEFLSSSNVTVFIAGPRTVGRKFLVTNRQPERIRAAKICPCFLWADRRGDSPLRRLAEVRRVQDEKSFRLTRQFDDLGHPDFTLDVK